MRRALKRFAVSHTTQEWEKIERGQPSRKWQQDIVKKKGTICSRAGFDRQNWKAVMEGYILQWMGKA